MAVIYLKHERHGSKVATSDLEVEHDMQYGWEVYDPTANEPSVNVQEEVAPVNTLEVKSRRRKTAE